MGKMRNGNNILFGRSEREGQSEIPRNIVNSQYLKVATKLSVREGEIGLRMCTAVCLAAIAKKKNQLNYMGSLNCRTVIRSYR
jgi:hypothetical protein